jgi:hypothetical protein
VFQNLSVKGVNNVHLVCQNLHQIANLFTGQRLRLCKDPTDHLQPLFQSSKLFEKLEFLEKCDYLLDPGKFQVIEEYLCFMGPHVKKLHIGGVRVDPKILQNLLNLLPNLQALEFFYVRVASQELESIK